MSFENIEHIVVLVMENRSFDHLLGYRFNTGSKHTNPKKLADGAARQVAGLKLQAPRFSPGPHHTYEHVARQLAVGPDGTPTMSGFVDDYAAVFGVTLPEMVMGYYDQETLPIYDYLAENYLVCDRWFCSVPGPTLPNRCFLFAGHSDGIVDNTHLAFHLLTHRVETVFEHLSANKVSWRSYYHDVPSLRFFKQFTLSLEHTSKMDQFYADAERGQLPSVSWIDPNFTVQGAVPLPGGIYVPDRANDDHPPADIRRGQQLVASVYGALRKNLAQWEKTLFILTYDEHGGFYDHVPPPTHDNLAPFNNRLFSRFGVRVPTFLISPWVSKGARTSDLSCCRGVDYEHTSIAKTILDRFCPWADVSAMGERLAGARSLRDVIENSKRDVSPPPIPDVESPPDRPRLAVGGMSAIPADLGVAEPATDFHRLVAGLGAHTAKTRRAPT
jgi:phospholipase C